MPLSLVTDEAEARAERAIPVRQRLLKRLAALKTERLSWDDHWSQLSEYIQPRKSRFLTSDRNVGSKKNDRIINGTATWAQRVLSSGMMAGITSPARPWFQLTTVDPALAEFGSAKEWLRLAEDGVRETLARSNIYNHLHQGYGALGTFGTSCTLLDDDLEEVLRAYTFPIGSYCLANDERLRVDTLFREFSMTVAQMVKAFKLPKCSPPVRRLYARGDLDQWFQVVHVIQPNDAYEPGRLGPQGKPWKSCWFERDGPDDVGLLRESGYFEFPVLAPRWDVTGEDVYGVSPGMDALGDVKALQHYELQKAMAIDKIVNPPMRGPPLMNGQASLLPGSYTAVESVHQSQVYTPAMTVDPRALGAISAEISQHEARASRAFFADLWQMLQQRSAGGEDAAMTAREVAERHEEKMLQLGPIMNRLDDELLDPLVLRTLNTRMRNGDLPPPPKELQGAPVRITYISILAQAQKMLGIARVDRLVGFVSSLAQFKPEILDKLDLDQAVDEYGSMLGTPPSLVRTDEDVAAIRAARAKQAQDAQAAAAAQGVVQSAQTLSQTTLEGDNALNRMLGGLGAPPAPAGTPGLQ